MLQVWTPSLDILDSVGRIKSSLFSQHSLLPTRVLVSKNQARCWTVRSCCQHESLSHAAATFNFVLPEIIQPELTTSVACWDHITSEINPSAPSWTYWGKCVQTTFYTVLGSLSSQWLGLLSNEVLEFSNETVYRACLFHMNQAQCVVR